MKKKVITPSPSLCIKPVNGKNIIVKDKFAKEHYDEFMSLKTTMDKYVWLKQQNYYEIGYTHYVYNQSEDGNSVTLSTVHSSASRINTNYHPIHSIIVSFTVYADGKVKMWTKSNRYEILNLLSAFYDFLYDTKIENGEVHKSISSEYSMFICKKTITKIVLGKITNKEQLIREYIKLNRLTISKNNLLKHISSNLCDVNVFSIEKAFDNVNLLYDNDIIIKLSREYVLYDMCQDAILTGMKYKSSWSFNRMMEEHRIRQSIITKKVLDNTTTSNEPVLNNTFEYNGFEQINSEKRAFEESMRMSNCVYNNYWRRIKSKEYLCFHITNPSITTDKNGVTLGMYYNRVSKKFEYEQAHGYKNSTLPLKSLDKIKKICSSKSMENYTQKYVIPKQTENVEENSNGIAIDELIANF